MNIARVRMEDAGWVTDLIKSLQETGFGVVSCAGPTADVLNERTLDICYRQWAEFFSVDGKHAYTTAGDGSGYFPMKSENAKGVAVKDLKEFFHMFAPDFTAPIPSYRTEKLADHLNLLGARILSGIDRSLEEDRFAPSIGGSTSTLLRVLHYPPVPRDVEPGAVRAAAHEDINLITLLPAASQPGLQVLDLQGNWHDVPCVAGDIIVNVGDMLQEATGGLFKSTTHRVVNPSGAPNVSRYSMPLFIHPRPEVRLSERYTAGEYLAERLREIGLK
jgi:isopenicillin N synthase-like dioxygenase